MFVFTATLAAGVALYIAPIISAAAHRYGILDRGDGNLKEQKQPVAYLGGLVVFIAMLVALSVTQQFDTRLLALLLGASLVVSVGLVDDLGTLVPKDKMLGQILAATVLVKGGISIEMTHLPSVVAYLGSVFWIVAVTNAFNIIDVSDGLCAGVGLVTALMMGIWSVAWGDPNQAYLCAALLGGLAGFLRVNWRPARMYLGDTGSMLIGMVLAAVVMEGRYSAVNDVAAFISPMALLCIPLFDLAFVMLCRLVLGLRIYHGSPDHFAVRMRRHGRSAARIAMTAMVLQLICGVGAVVAALGTNLQAAGVGAAGLVGALIVAWRLWRLDPRRPPAPMTPVTPETQPQELTR